MSGFRSRPQCVRSSLDRRVQAVRYAVQVLVKGVRVDVQSHRRFGVAKHPLDRFHVGARTHGEAGRGVTQVVRRNGRERLIRRLAPCDCWPEYPRTPVRVPQDAATLVGQNQIVTRVGGYPPKIRYSPVKV
jgi:hypothetical protein